MPTSVELIWQRDCPNVEAARTTLRQALVAADLAADWVEWEIGEHALPAHARGYGSPTILVNGREVTGQAAGDSDDCCRVYATADGYAGVPSLEIVVARLGDETSRS